MGSPAQRTIARAKRNIRWIETYCRVPEGPDVGQPIKLRPWQRKILIAIYAKDTRRVIVSFGRKNAKTTLCACILLLHLVGPEVRVNSELYSSAMSREQAALLFKIAAKIIRLDQELSDLITIRETVKQLHCAYYGTMYQALSADAPTAFGLNPVLIVHDELGQVKGQDHPLYEALETSTGAQVSPLSVIISTQAPTANDLLSVLIDDALKEEDPRTHVFLYTADENADPFDVETIKQANPAFGDFQDTKEILDMAEAARRIPSREASYRNLVLNQRVQVHSPFISASVWKACGGEPSELGPVYGGLDLSVSNDLTAFVLVSPVQGVLHVRPIFWLPEEGLADKARQDHQSYDLWAKQGFLKTTPGRSVEYAYVAKKIADAFGQYDIRRVAFDRWNMKHLRPWLIEAGLSEGFIDDRFVEFGQGYQSMSPALRETETMFLNEKVRHGNHPVLQMCAANAVVEMDPAGNRKLTKKKSYGRIDGMVALVMAASLAAAEMNQKKVFDVKPDKVFAEMSF